MGTKKTKQLLLRLTDMMQEMWTLQGSAWFASYCQKTHCWHHVVMWLAALIARRSCNVGEARVPFVEATLQLFIGCSTLDGCSRQWIVRLSAKANRRVAEISDLHLRGSVLFFPGGCSQK